MIVQIIVGCILGLPVLFGLLFRVSASHIFFSLMAGELLGRYFGHDVEKSAQPMLERSHATGYGEIILIILPMILTAIFMRKTISKGKAILHIPALLVTGVICAAFVLPLLPDALRSQVSEFIVGKKILDYNRTIIGAMLVLQLVSLWILNRKEQGKKGHGHK